MNVGIVGLGLIGGSLARALKKRPGFHITGMSRSERTRAQALGDGVCDIVTGKIDHHFSSCDIVFLCSPVETICSYAEALAAWISPDCILTDAGSTKKNIYEQMLHRKDLYFIGGHPMAGSEKTGYEESRDYLFENAFYILTPVPWIKQNQLDLLQGIVRDIGAIPLIMSPDDHDYAVAGISHLPHVVASALVSLVEDSDGKEGFMHTLAAGGFRDITRIASAGPSLWSAICLENQKELLSALSRYEDILKGFYDCLKNGDAQGLEAFFSKARAYRDSFQYGRPFRPSTALHEIKVDIEDSLGTLAEVAMLLARSGVNIKNIGIVNSREYEEGVLQVLLESEEQKERGIQILEKRGYSVYHDGQRPTV